MHLVKMMVLAAFVCYVNSDELFCLMLNAIVFVGLGRRAGRGGGLLLLCS